MVTPICNNLKDKRQTNQVLFNFKVKRVKQVDVKFIYSIWKKQNKKKTKKKCLNGEEEGESCPVTYLSC